MNPPTVSIIMPCYQVSAYVAEALQSAFSQTVQDFEILLVNDGSPDTEQLEAAIGPWRDRIHYIHKPNGGVASARNAALHQAKGTWIAALDPDDTWEPTYLETQLRFAADHPEAAIIYGDAIIFGDSAEGTRISALSPSEGDATFEALVEERCTIPHSASMVRRQAVLDAGGYDECLRTGEDFDLWLRIVSTGGTIRYHREALARYRRRPNSLISDSIRAAENYRNVLQKARVHYARTDSAQQSVSRQEKVINSRVTLFRAKLALDSGAIAAALVGFEAVQQLTPSRKLYLLILGLQRAPFLVQAALYLRGLLYPVRDTKGEGSLSQRGAWMLGAKLAGFALSTAFPLLLIRRLPQSEFGLYRQVFLIINTATTILPLSLGMSAYYFLPREPQRKGAVTANILLFLFVAGGLAGGALVLWPSLAERLTSEPAVLPYIPAMASLIMLWTVGSLVEPIMLANVEVRLAALATAAIQIARTVLLILAVIILPTLSAVLSAAVLQGMLQCAIVAVYINSRFGNPLRQIDVQLLRRQLSYAIPLGFAGLLYSLQTDLHNYFISSRFGAAIFAIYSVGCFQLPVMGLIGEALASVLIPQVAILQQQGDSEAIIDILLRATRKMALVAFPLSCYLLVVAPEFLTLLYTDRYAASVPLFRINLALVPLSVLITDPILRAYARYRYVLLTGHIILFAAQFALLWWATARYTIASALVIVVCVTLVERFGKLLWCGSILGFSKQDLSKLSPIAHIFLASVVSGLATLLIKLALPPAPKVIVLTACGMVFGLLEAALLYRMRVVTPEEVSLIQRLLPARWRFSL